MAGEMVDMVARRPHMHAGRIVAIGDPIRTERSRARELKSLGLAAFRRAADDTLGESEDVETTDKTKPIELNPPGDADAKAAPAPENKMRPGSANKSAGPANGKVA